MYLVIAEKPSVSQTIGKVIGAYKREDGYLEGKDCLVSWCLGHLAEYVPPEVYEDRYKSWNFEDLPIIPEDWKLAVMADKKEQFAVLRELLNRDDVDYVVNACDAGREGELIFKRVYDLSGSTLPVKRLWISSMEDSAVREGFAHLKNASEYENLAMASVCRAQADWLVGMNATRAYTTKYYKKLTVGRVQTPTLAMLVERENQIQNFQKEKYFNIHLDCGELVLHKEKVFDSAEAEDIIKKCDGTEAVVTSVISKEKKEHPPKLYDLTSLQRESNRHYGYTAKQTLEYVQSLYEKKLVTYPRTDSQYLSDDMHDTALEVLVRITAVYPEVSNFDVLEADIPKVLDSKKVSDHHAIIPTCELTKESLKELSDGETKILRLIAQRLLCAVGSPYIYNETVVTASCCEYEFSEKGKKLIDQGWKVFLKAMDTEKESEQDKILPELTEGQKFASTNASKTEHYTAPPKSYSEDTLLASMETAGKKKFDEDTERKGLGTPATRANIIEKLVTTGYARRKGKQLVPTEDGMELIAVMPDVLKSAGMTAEWENQLLAMEHGKVKNTEFMDGILRLLHAVLDECSSLTKEECQRFHPRESIGCCPVCGGLVFEGKTNYYCENRDCSFALWKDNRFLGSMRKKLDTKMAAELLKDRKTHVKGLYSVKKDKKFDADLVMDVKDGKANFSLEFPKKLFPKSGIKSKSKGGRINVKGK